MLQRPPSDLTAANKTLDPEIIIEKINNLPESYPAEEIIMTLTEQWLQEGIQIGKQRGVKEGKQEAKA